MKMPDTKCFFIKPYDYRLCYLRRYRGHGSDNRCEESGIGYHNAKNLFYIVDHDAAERRGFRTEVIQPDRFDSRWPVSCACGEFFEDDDEWQVFYENSYIDPITDIIYTLGKGDENSAPVGAYWRNDWMRVPHWVIRTPVTDWHTYRELYKADKPLEIIKDTVEEGYNYKLTVEQTFKFNEREFSLTDGILREL